MKIAIAQINSDPNSFRSNIDRHFRFIKRARIHEANAIFFPELSISVYEPALARQSAVALHDLDLTPFSILSREANIVTGIGVPTSSGTDIFISMLIFQTDGKSETYSKQILHEDERPYFSEGKEQMFIHVGPHKIAPAICYESLQPGHARNAVQNGANLYLASVAKSKEGVEKAYLYYPQIARKYKIPVLMANCTGYCGNFESAGSSAVWSDSGVLLAKLGQSREGLLIFDTGSGKVTCDLFL